MAAVSRPHEAWLTGSTVDALSTALGEPSAVLAARRAAHEAFLELALEPDPLYRKYGYFAGVDLTGVDPLARGAAVAPPAAPPSTVLVVHDASGTRVTMDPALGAAGVRVETLPEMIGAGGLDASGFLSTAEPPADRLAALGTALMNRGLRVALPDDLGVPVRLKDVTVLSRPHEALSVRRSIRLGRGSRLLVSEEVYSTQPVVGVQRLYGSSTDLEVGEGARAAYLTLHAPDTTTVSIYARSASLASSSRLGWVWSGFGGFRTKVRNHSILEGRACELEDLQTFYGLSDQSYDSSIRMTHRGTDTKGQSVTRGVFKDTSRGMSRGLVRIEHEARRTLSFLSEHAMLLSRGTRSDTIPILEILCRDVKATHSSSVAPVDPEKVFYLESRGVAESDAIRMIGEGFLSHVLERAPFADLREVLYPYLAARWEGRSIDWADRERVSLPPLEFRGADAETEWRFDTKLR